MEKREICYHNYYINQIKVVLKIDGEVYNFKGYRNEKDLICISNPKEFLEKSGYKVYNNSDNSNYEIEKNNIKIKISKVSCTEFKRTVPFLLNNIYLGEFCEKTDFDFKKVDEKTYIVFNLESLRHMGLNWNDEKLKTAFFIRKNLKNNFQMEFVCGLIGNIVNEGEFGHFESSNYKKNPNAKPSYLKHMDDNHNYSNLVSGKKIYNLKQGIGIFDILIDCGSVNHKFGFGCVQWTGGNRQKNLIYKYKELGNIKPSFNQCANIETEYIKFEFEGDYKYIYNYWKDNNMNNDSEKKVINASNIICEEYERPSYYQKQEKLNTRRKSSLEWFNIVEKGSI